MDMDYLEYITVEQVTTSNYVISKDTPDKSNFRVYYCYCGEYIIIIDKDIRKLPQRKTDKALVIINNKRSFKLNVADGSWVILKRPSGYEKQFRMKCPRCKLFVAYQFTEKIKEGPYTYIVEGALIENQDDIPEDGKKVSSHT